MRLCSQMFSAKSLVHLEEEGIQISTLTGSDHQKINCG